MAEEREVLSYWVAVGSQGELTVPPEMLSALGVAPADMVNLTVVDGVLEIRSADSAWREAQRILAPGILPGVSIVDELIADRRREVQLESDVKGDAAE
ncbi:hypothetical protein NML43_05990 [Rhodopseudomonas palustris]|uniref:hypothetical protein n=1 Tax=Rhodopseudomonas palustris TaxID=1076 RepID=UPI0020CB89D9|nr:hypothetical protein [Rhodopseudomonas palustris]MCP9626632.1 hypothetical protein [Rhodopseudomonas palustris]